MKTDREGMAGMEEKRTPAKSTGDLMLKVLFGAILVGFGMMFLKAYMLSHGYAEAWSWINWLLFQDITAKGANTSIGLFYILQTLFLNGIQLVIVPLVISSIALSVCSITDTVKLGRIACKTVLGFLLFYVIGCLIAIFVARAAVAAGLFNADFSSMAAGTSKVQEFTVANPLNLLLKFIPANFVQPLTNNHSILAVIFMGAGIGMAINTCGEKLYLVREAMEEIQLIITKWLEFLINKCGPVCIFCMIVRTFSIYSWDQITPFLHYIGITFVVLILYWFTVYPLLVGSICKVNPIKFFKKTFGFGMFALSVNSSAATLPLNRRACIEDLGCSPTVADFVLPMGMTINMNGTAIEHVIATAFIATAAGLPISTVAYITIMVLAIGSAAGTPAIPNGGTVMLYATMTGAGFSTDLCIMIYIVLMTLHRPIDMTVTALNVVGDAATTCLVSASEGELNQKVFNA